MIWLLGGYIWLYVHRPFEIWPELGNLQIERIYMLVMFVIWLVNPKTFPSNRAHLGMGLFALAMVVTWIASPYSHLPASSELVENYFKVAVFYVLVITTIKDEQSLRRILQFFLLAVTFYVTHSLFEYVNGRYEHRMGTNRMVGVGVTYADPNAFAGGLLITLVVSLIFWREKPRRMAKSLLIGFAGMCALCILLTGSRSGFLGLVVLMLALPLLFMKRRFTAIAVICLGVLLGGGLMLALPDNLQNRYLTIVDSSHGPANAQLSAEGRLTGFYYGVHLFQMNPLMGSGPGTFPKASGLNFQPHNLYGQLIGEMGMVGVMAFLMVLACFAFNVRETFRLAREIDGPPDVIGPVRSSLAYQVSLIIGLCVLLLLILGFAGHNLYRYHWQWLTAFQVVAVACLRKQAIEASLSPQWGHTLVPLWQPAV